MKILELSPRYIDEDYNGNIKAAIKAEDGNIWTLDRLHNAFNYNYLYGRSDMEAFTNYMINNIGKYSIFYDMESKKIMDKKNIEALRRAA